MSGSTQLCIADTALIPVKEEIVFPFALKSPAQLCKSDLKMIIQIRCAKILVFLPCSTAIDENSTI